jgi:ComF family protein
MQRGGWRFVTTMHQSLLDWIFPARCMGCQQVGQVLCPDCKSNIAYIEKNYCIKCGTPLDRESHSLEHTCIHSEALTAIRSATLFSGVIRQAIVGLKYHRSRYYADALVHLSRSRWPIQEWEIDYILPIPSTPQSLRRHGYNQSEWLARSLASQSDLPWTSRFLQKRESVGTQVGLSASVRKQNIKNAFTGRDCKGLTLLLIDDVCTTGATLESAADALRNAGAKRVYAVTVARTLPARHHIRLSD